MSVEGNKEDAPRTSLAQMLLGAGIMFSGLFVMNKPDKAAALDENIAEFAKQIGGTENLSYVGIAIALVGIGLLATATRKNS